MLSLVWHSKIVKLIITGIIIKHRRLTPPIVSLMLVASGLALICSSMSVVTTFPLGSISFKLIGFFG